MSHVSKDIIEDRVKMKSLNIERILGIHQKSFSDKNFIELPETQALLKMIYSMPWLLEVVDNDFNPEITKGILVREAGKAMICGHGNMLYFLETGENRIEQLGQENAKLKEALIETLYQLDKIEKFSDEKSIDSLISGYGYIAAIVKNYKINRDHKILISNIMENKC
jgi:hypothetical protein